MVIACRLARVNQLAPLYTSCVQKLNGSVWRYWRWSLEDQNCVRLGLKKLLDYHINYVLNGKSTD